MSKVASLILALLLGLGLTVNSLMAAPAQADPNAKARQEYAVLDKALKANGWKAKAAALRAFVQAHPDSQYKDYAQKQALAAQQQLVVELYQKKDMAALGPASEQLLRMRPGDENGLGGALEAFYAAKNYAKAARYGEQLYAKKPTPGIAAALADCYDKLKDSNKFATYARTVTEGKSDKEAFPTTSSSSITTPGAGVSAGRPSTPRRCWRLTVLTNYLPALRRTVGIRSRASSIQPWG